MPQDSIAKKMLILLTILIVFSTGLFTGLQFKESQKLEISVEGEIIRAAQNEYEFINPLIGFEIGAEENFPELNPLRFRIEKYIDESKASRTARNISVYFRDMNTGKWIGIDEDQKYAPASMLKVVVMIAYLKYAELNPSILSKEIYYDGAVDRNDYAYYKPKKSLKGGASYSVSELIKRMIIQSGNNSYHLLISNFDETVMDTVYKDMGIPIEEADRNADFVSGKEYSMVFRVLYNATYFSSRMSEKALKILSATEFKKGLVAGVPRELKVAHKFGERALFDQQNGEQTAVKELHDCGIIYYPSKPYFLCVMTKGGEFENLETVIKNISKITYEFMSAGFGSE